LGWATPRHAQRGEDEAWSLLFEHYHDHLLLAVRLRLRSVLEGADIFQSVALEAYRNFDGRPSKEVAQLLDKSDDAVQKLYSRAVASLAMRMNSGESP
jgi:DNA-directed RNA polymerase specialized sigma24 family protein